MAQELIDTIISHDLIEGEPEVQISTQFDEYSCTLSLQYQGKGFPLPDKRPTPEKLLESPDAAAELAGYLIRKLADKAKLHTSNDRVEITLQFED